MSLWSSKPQLCVLPMLFISKRPRLEQPACRSLAEFGWGRWPESLTGDNQTGCKVESLSRLCHVNRPQDLPSWENICNHFNQQNPSSVYYVGSMALVEEKRYSTKKETWRFKGWASGPKSEFQRNSEKERDHSGPSNIGPSFHLLYLDCSFLCLWWEGAGVERSKGPGDICGSPFSLFCSPLLFRLLPPNSLLTPSDFWILRHKLHFRSTKLAVILPQVQN